VGVGAPALPLGEGGCWEPSTAKVRFYTIPSFVYYFNLLIKINCHYLRTGQAAQNNITVKFLHCLQEQFGTKVDDLIVVLGSTARHNR
jgi:hypothetical protein